MLLTAASNRSTLFRPRSLASLFLSLKVQQIANFLLLTLALSFVFAGDSMADVISPAIGEADQSYSNEPANAAFFGKGVSGRMSEASYLRFAGEQALLEAKFKEAYQKFAKAVQLDPGDPTGHVMLARSMTGILRKQKIEELDRQLLMRTIHEWKLIQRHDADISEQFEATANLHKLSRVQKLIKERDAKINEQSDKATVAAKANFELR